MYDRLSVLCNTLRCGVCCESGAVPGMQCQRCQSQPDWHVSILLGVHGLVIVALCQVQILESKIRSSSHIYNTSIVHF